MALQNVMHFYMPLKVGVTPPWVAIGCNYSLHGLKDKPCFKVGH